MPFTIKELSSLFGKTTYLRLDHPYQFWCPLIALFHGMRRREVAQLYLDGIKQTEDGTWIFDLNVNRPDQSLKNKSAKRIIPIHSFLRKDLKLLSYVRHLRAKGEKRLFPELSYNQREGYGRALGRWFNDKYKHRCGIDMSDGKLRDFHSFRKNWDTLLIQKNVDWYARLKTVGHKGNVDDMSDLYFAGHPPKQLHDDVISKVDWEKQIDLSHLKESKFVLKG